MTVKRVPPGEAKRMIEEDGYAYVDVRSIPEFEQGHPEGAYNVPIAHMSGGGMTPNHDFVKVMEASFPKDARLIMGCRSGGRSLQAAQVLQAAGYREVVDQRAGYEGPPGEPGWAPLGLPTAREAQPGRAYADLETKSQA